MLQSVVFFSFFVLSFLQNLFVLIGFLKGNARYGAVPKIIAAAAVGYFAGKFSYQTKCAERLMQLPNSRIGEMLRQRRRQGNTEM